MTKNHRVLYNFKYKTWIEARDSGNMHEEDIVGFLKQITSKPYPAINIRIVKTIDVTEKFEELMRELSANDKEEANH